MTSIVLSLSLSLDGLTHVKKKTWHETNTDTERYSQDAFLTLLSLNAWLFTRLLVDRSYNRTKAPLRSHCSWRLFVIKKRTCTLPDCNRNKKEHTLPDWTTVTCILWTAPDNTAGSPLARKIYKEMKEMIVTATGTWERWENAMTDGDEGDFKTYFFAAFMDTYSFDFICSTVETP